jgi:hypothetical protein
LIVRLRWTRVKVRIRLSGRGTWRQAFSLPPAFQPAPGCSLSVAVLPILLLALGIPIATVADLPPVPKPPPASPHEIWSGKIQAFMRQKNFAQPYYIREIIQDAVAASIPPPLVVCIEFTESSGGKYFARETNNPLGWKSGTASFPSVREAIRHVSAQLGSGRYYAGKTLAEKLRTYNPRPEYSVKVMDCMRRISEEPQP